VDLALLQPEVRAEERGALLAEAASLLALPAVVSAGVIEAEGESDFDLAFYFVIASPADLEGFGTDARYVRFLQGGLARCLRSFAGADIALDADLPPPDSYGACLALVAPPRTYDWQVRDALAAWAGDMASAATGLAVGERQRYRGLGIGTAPSRPHRPNRGLEGFGADFIAGRLRVFAPVP
jgi:hypothetical protein